MNLKHSEEVRPGMFVLFQVECLYDEFCNPIHKKYPFDSSCKGFPCLVLRNRLLATHLRHYKQELSLLISDGKIKHCWIPDSNFIECFDL